MKKILCLAVLALGCAGLSGCGIVGVAAGAGATVGVAAAQEGGLKGATDDAAIRIEISDYWFKHSVDMYRRLNLTVREGRVLVTGSVPYPDMRVDAIRLAWQADGVKQVINEVKIDKGAGFTGYLTDTWITGQLKADVMFDKFVQSINYTFDTEEGTVYIMGIAQNQRELDRVLDYARNTRYVKNVVSYVRLRGQTPPGVIEDDNAPPQKTPRHTEGSPAGEKPVSWEPASSSPSPSASPPPEVRSAPLDGGETKSPGGNP